jgi:hypothetical protein
MQKFVVAALGLGLVGCTSVPETAKGPLPSNSRALLAQTVRSSLKDPYSVREAAYVVVEEKGAHYACVQLNAKNSFGAYAGMTRLFYYWNGQTWVSNSMKMGMEQYMKNNGMGVGTCPEATRPFPELGA